MIPQTDTSTASFTGNYSFGAQSFYTGLGFDFVGQGSMTGGTLNGTGLLSDIFDVFNTTATGGYTGQGDGKCPAPLPPADRRREIWRHR